MEAELKVTCTFIRWIQECTKKVVIISGVDTMDKDTCNWISGRVISFTVLNRKSWPELYLQERKEEASKSFHLEDPCLISERICWNPPRWDSRRIIMGSSLLQAPKKRVLSYRLLKEVYSNDPWTCKIYQS